MTDQIALNVIVYTNNLFYRTELLPAWCNWTCHHGLPAWDPIQNSLVEPYLPHHPIGIVHLIHLKAKCDPARLATTDGKTIEADLRDQPQCKVETLAEKYGTAVSSD